MLFTHLRGINDSSVDHVDVDVVKSVIAEVGVVSFHDLIDDDGRVDSGVLGDLHHRLLQSVANNFDTLALILICCRDVVQNAKASIIISGKEIRF